MQAANLEKAYRHCEQFVRNHYENFPVASRFLPKKLRRPIAAIYAYARTADDMADEGDVPAEQRLQQLQAYGRQLEVMADSEDPVFIALAHVIRQYHLPIRPFHDLLTAFKMDVRKKRYANFPELLYYCQHSANPIGRMLVYLNHRASDETMQYADVICTALQLINFYQDLAQDYSENDRIYIPLDEMRHYAVSEKHFQAQISDMAMQHLMTFQIRRARDMLLSGRRLGTILPGRMGLELRMVIAGGMQICEKLTNNNGNVFARPRLNKRDWLLMFWRAVTRT